MAIRHPSEPDAAPPPAPSVARGIPDWRNPDSYRHLLELDREGWAWEWLRRNPGYREHVRERRREMDTALDRAILPSHSREDADWGCIFAEDADVPATQARLLWSARHSAAVIVAEAVPAESRSRDSLDFARLGVAAAIAQAPGEPERVALSDGYSRIRLDIVIGTVARGPVALTCRIAPFGRLTPKLLTLRRLASLLRTGSFVPELHRPEALPSRWVASLRAVDAKSAGASERDIAGELLGDRWAEHDWRGDSDWSRLRVQRLVRAGRTLIGGGYLRLLS